MRPQLDRNRYDASPSYNDWLDEQYSDSKGELDIWGFQPRPSEVLFTMSPDTYEAVFPDFMQQREEAIKDAVFNRFPAPIAYYFYRFDNGFESELQRLLLLRDTWEAVVDVLHSLAVSEIRHRQIRLDQPLKFSDLLSDRIAQRLENIEEISRQLQAAGIVPDFHKIASPATIAVMKSLNQERNAFSHSPAQSEMQARAWITECYDDVLDVLEDLSDLENVLIVRYLGQPAAAKLRCETFVGHGATKTIKVFDLTPQQIAESIKYFQQGQLFAIVDGHIFSLRPVIHYREVAAGHTTRLCMFRKTHGDAPNRTIEYSVLGEAVSHYEDRVNFSAELTEIRALFGLGVD